MLRYPISVDTCSTIRSLNTYLEANMQMLNFLVMVIIIENGPKMNAHLHHLSKCSSHMAGCNVCSSWGTADRRKIGLTPRRSWSVPLGPWSPELTPHSRVWAARPRASKCSIFGSISPPTRISAQRLGPPKQCDMKYLPSEWRWINNYHSSSTDTLTDCAGRPLGTKHSPKVLLPECRLWKNLI